MLPGRCARRQTLSSGACRVGVILHILPIGAEAQQAGKVYRIGWLAPESLPKLLDAFRDGLRAFGYVEVTTS